MARSRSGSKSSYSSNNRQRVTFVNANRRLTAYNFTPPSPLLAYEDRRTFYPDPIRPAASFSRSNHRLTVKKSVSPGVPTHIQFEDPERVLVCVRRGVRKEVLHALKKTGRGSARGRRRLNQYSEVSC